MTGSVADAYSRTGAAWDAGPRRIYGRLSEVLVAVLPGGVEGRCVLDLGAGTGAAGRAAVAAGAARVVALDAAIGLLRVNAGERPPAVAGDARRLPFAATTFGAVVAAFSLNHVVDPTAALAEVARVLRPGGGVAVSAYASDDIHPVKRAVDRACADRGWEVPEWYRALQRDAVPLLATPERALAAASSVLPGARAETVRVAFPELDRRALVSWRLGMPHLAPFVATLSPATQRALAEEASALLPADAPPLERSIVVLTWQKG
jgi:ubiquinone/menaquinone biosynthesis C-methylase UbiE